MNIKKKKIILNDEVKEFLTIMEKENFDNKFRFSSKLISFL